MSRPLIIHGFRFQSHAADAQRWMLCVDGRIATIATGAAPTLPDCDYLDARGRSIMPGFFDVHVHGSAGYDTMDATRESLHGMARFFAQQGVTAFLATTWSDTNGRITAALEAVQAAMADPWDDGARLLGVHLEGPYLNTAKCGAQNAAVIRRADPAEYLPWLELDVIRLAAIAPEFPENQAFMAECLKRGITVSCAHTDATYEQMDAAIGAGLRHSTHTFNAMRSLNHRDPGVVGAVMADRRVRCELIPDGIHVHPGAMRALANAKGPQGILLITDAMRAAGMPEGEYEIDAGKVVHKEGAVRLADGTLAGSALTFAQGVRRFKKALGITQMEELHAYSSTNAARSLNLKGVGEMTTNSPADLVLVDADINVFATIIGGRVVFQAE